MSKLLGELIKYGHCPSDLWWQVPRSRRASVLVLLFESRHQLTCVLTQRAQGLSFSNDAAFPGGKADDDQETPWQVATRETYEEIGISSDPDFLASKDCRLSHVATLPFYLSRNFLLVQPCVAYLEQPLHIGLNGAYEQLPFLVPGLVNKAEVSKVFAAMVKCALMPAADRYYTTPVCWKGLEWNTHNFAFLLPNKQIGDPGFVNVWGLTADVLLDVARIVYAREPNFPHRPQGQIGDQPLIQALLDRRIFHDPAQRELDFPEILGDNNPLLSYRKAKPVER